MENKTQNLAYWRQNAEEDYMTTPISVLRYISEIEKALDTSSVVGRSEQCKHDYQPCKHEAISEFDKCSKCGKII